MLFYDFKDTEILVCFYAIFYTNWTALGVNFVIVEKTDFKSGLRVLQCVNL